MADNRSASKISLPPVLQRHELKYLIPASMMEPISQFITPYCELDYHSLEGENYFYEVNSFYFDTRDGEFLKQRLYGRDSRFNMRVRSYAGGKPPFFLEIKHRSGGLVKKYRATATEEEWPAILLDPHYRVPRRESGVGRRNKELFMRLAHSYAIEPKIYTQYRRQAYFSTVNDYARVTMDKNMKYRVQDLNSGLEDPYDMSTDDSLTNYDNETIYAVNTHSEADVVLELKCNVGQVPVWMLDLVKHFQLKQVGFSKYMNSSLVSQWDNGIRYNLGNRMDCQGMFN